MFWLIMDRHIARMRGTYKVGRDGERGRNRTDNLKIKSLLLCQLSYAPQNHDPAIHNAPRRVNPSEALAPVLQGLSATGPCNAGRFA
jgi:hypothetical protein